MSPSQLATQTPTAKAATMNVELLHVSHFWHHTLDILAKPLHLLRLLGELVFGSVRTFGVVLAIPHCSNGSHSRAG